MTFFCADSSRFSSISRSSSIPSEQNHRLSDYSFPRSPFLHLGSSFHPCEIIPLSGASSSSLIVRGWAELSRVTFTYFLIFSSQEKSSNSSRSRRWREIGFAHPSALTLPPAIYGRVWNSTHRRYRFPARGRVPASLVTCQRKRMGTCSLLVFRVKGKIVLQVKTQGDGYPSGNPAIVAKFLLSLLAKEGTIVADLVVTQIADALKDCVATL